MAFDNPIVAGEKLIRDAIQSPDYVATVSGWTINKDGTVEFNEALIRGIVSVVGPEGTIEIVLDGARPVIRMWNEGHTKYAYLNVPDELAPGDAPIGIGSGAFASAYTGGNQFANLFMFSPNQVELSLRKEAGGIAGGPVGGSVYLHEKGGMIQGWNADDVKLAQIGVFPGDVNKGAVFLQGSTDGLAMNTRQVVLGNATGLEFLRLLNEGWQNLTIVSGSALAGQTPQCRLFPDGVVRFRGCVTGFAVGAVVVLNVPAAYRPTQAHRFELPPNTSGGSNACEIQTDGDFLMTRNTVQSMWINQAFYTLE